MKKLFAVLMALTLVLSMGAMAFAADTGTITINNAIEKHTYTIYEMLKFTASNDDGSAGVYEIIGGWEDFFKEETGAQYFDVTAEGKVSLKEGKTVDSDLAKAAIAYAKDETNGITATATDTVPDGADSITFTGLEFGYYAIDTTVGTICSLSRANNDLEALEKNSMPQLEKKILENSNLVDANTVAIGDTVTYQAKITIGEGVENYIMHDKMSDGLTFKEITNVEASNGSTVKYTIVADEQKDAECDFEIAFDNDYTSLLPKNTTIIVTYTAELNNNAVIGSTGNPNEAWLEYGDEYTTTVDTVITYTTSFKVNKVDANGNPLEGAEFTLSKLVDGAWTEIGLGTTNTEGTEFTWDGLDEGTYKVEETKVPAGYNKAEDEQFTITCTVPGTVNNVTDEANWEVAGNDDVIETNDTFETTIKNTTGALLPETGGIGTTIFYVVGGLLMLAAFIVLVSKKRMASFA